MQSLLSPIDSHSQHSSYRHRDMERANNAESTPLLTHQFVRQQSAISGHNLLSWLMMLIMALILLAGVIIAAYLLIEQEHWMPKDRQNWEKAVARPTFA